MGRLKYNFEDIEFELERCGRLQPDFSQVKENLQVIYRAVFAALEGQGRDGGRPSQPPAVPGIAVRNYFADLAGLLAGQIPDLDRSLAVFFRSMAKALAGLELVDSQEWDGIYQELSRHPDGDFFTVIFGLTLHAFCSQHITASKPVARGACPVCGAKPHFGILSGDEGSKKLECWRCSARWSFPRLHCPFCDNTDHQSLGYFTVANDHHCRIHFCQRCRHYHKVFDLRGSEARVAVLPVRNLATLVGDKAALQEGFVAGSGLKFFTSNH